MKLKNVPVTLLMFLFMINSLPARDRQFPYEFKKKDFLLLPLGVGMTIFGESLCDNHRSITLGEIKSLDRKDVNGFDRSATYNWSPQWGDRSDTYRDILTYSSLFLLSVPPLFHAKFSETGTVVLMFTESVLFLSGITFIIKAEAGRRRPYVYNTDLSVEERYAMGGNDAFFSFFSGHTAAAFTAATFLSKVISDIHGDSIWTKLLWGSSLTVAAMTGYARVKAGKHYPTDVIAGAAVGFAIGYLIPALHKKKNNNRVSLILFPNRIGICLKL
jgi:membrane-associated phospholipid phosphatase